MQRNFSRKMLLLSFNLILVTSFVLLLVFTRTDSHSMQTTTTQSYGYEINAASDFYGYQTLANRPYPMYDYSVHLIKTGEDTGDRYRAFVGGRWQSAWGDGDHILQYTSSTGRKDSPWSMWSDAPEFYLGYEEGEHNRWYSNNTMDPEVMRAADGSGWLMYVQVQIERGDPIDIPGLTANSQADRIMLLTSQDCKTWTKMKSRGVVTNISNPQTTMLHHQEMIYVPWDEDNKPYWMYVCVNENDVYTGIYRIRSSDYTTFDFSTKELVNGMSQIGNQVGYLKEAPGGPLFVRITFVDTGSRTVPALQFSIDGLNWDAPSIQLEGSDNNGDNKNCYFLGLATIEGTGQIEYCGNNTWKTIYGATTCNTPVAPEIFHSQAGVGSLTISIDNPVNQPVTADSITTNILERAPDGSYIGYGDSFKVYANNVKGATRVLFPVWTEKNGQDDLEWIEGRFDAENNRWEATIRRQNHNNEFGKYFIHAYGVNGIGVQNGIGACPDVILNPEPVTYQSITTSTNQYAPDGSYLAKGNSFQIYVNGVTGATRVQFPTWTVSDWQDDLEWIEGVYDPVNNRWVATIYRSNHKNEYGLYNTDIYAINQEGQRVGLQGGIRVTLEP